MRALAKLTWVVLKLFIREPFAVIFTFAFPLVVLVVLNGVFGKHPDPDFGGARPTDHYLAGYIAVVIGAIGLVALPVHVAAYRERGFSDVSGPRQCRRGASWGSGDRAIPHGDGWEHHPCRGGYARVRHCAPASVGGTVAAFVVGALIFLAIGFLMWLLEPCRTRG